MPSLSWKGTVYEVAPLLMADAKRCASLRKQIAAAVGDEERQIELAVELLDALHCPPTVAESVSVAELESLWLALMQVHYTPATGGGGTNRPTEDGSASATS